MSSGSYPSSIQISYKVVKISADANLELMSEIKQLFIGVFQFAAG